MKIWITYTFEDKEFVGRITKYLIDEGYEVLDVEKEILPGDNIVLAISDAISKADVILVVISKNSNEKQWFSAEIGLVVSEIRKNNQKKIIPLLKDRTALPPFIDQYQFLDLSDSKDFDEQMVKLTKSLQIRKQGVIEDHLLQIEQGLVNSRNKLLEFEQKKYEVQKHQRDRLVSVTFLTTLLAASGAFISLLIGEHKLFSFISFSNNSVVIAIFSCFLGVAVTLILNKFYKK